MCNGVPRTSEFYRPPVNVRIGRRRGAHLDRDGRLGPVGFASPCTRHAYFTISHPKMRSQKRQLPQARCLVDCPFQKLGSRMDAPIFVFDRDWKFHTFGAYFNR